MDLSQIGGLKGMLPSNEDSMFEKLAKIAGSWNAPREKKMPWESPQEGLPSPVDTPTMGALAALAGMQMKNPRLAGMYDTVNMPSTLLLKLYRMFDKPGVQKQTMDMVEKLDFPILNNRILKYKNKWGEGW